MSLVVIDCNVHQLPGCMVTCQSILWQVITSIDQRSFCTVQIYFFTVFATACHCLDNSASDGLI